MEYIIDNKDTYHAPVLILRTLNGGIYTVPNPEANQAPTHERIAYALTKHGKRIIGPVVDDGNLLPLTVASLSLAE